MIATNAAAQTTIAAPIHIHFLDFGGFEGPASGPLWDRSEAFFVSRRKSTINSCAV
jgi:hypothetical protein